MNTKNILSALGGMCFGFFGAVLVLSEGDSQNQSADFFRKPIPVVEKENSSQGENSNSYSQNKDRDGVHRAPSEDEEDYSEQQKKWQEEFQLWEGDRLDEEEGSDSEDDIFHGEEMRKKWEMERKQKAIQYCQKNYPDYLRECVRDFLQKLGEERDEADGKEEMKREENSRMMEKKNQQQKKLEINLRELVLQCLKEEPDRLRECIQESVLENIRQESEETDEESHNDSLQKEEYRPPMPPRRQHSDEGFYEDGFTPLPPVEEEDISNPTI